MAATITCIVALHPVYHGVSMVIGAQDFLLFQWCFGKSPLDIQHIWGQKILALCPRLVTCIWNVSVCTWLWAGGHNQSSVSANEWWSWDWYGHSMWLRGRKELFGRWNGERSAVAMAPAHCAQWAWKIATWGFAFSLALSLFLVFSLSLCRCPVVSHHTTKL